MAITVTTLEKPIDSYSKGNAGLIANFALTGTTSADKTVRAAVADEQIFARGHIRASGATVITIQSEVTPTPIAVMEFLAAGTQEIPKCYTKAGEALEIASTNTVTIGGVVKTLSVKAGFPVPPIWAM